MQLNEWVVCSLYIISSAISLYVYYSGCVDGTVCIWTVSQSTTPTNLTPIVKEQTQVSNISCVMCFVDTSV